MLCLYLEAPFATFRTFAAGSYRPSAGFITYSAAYGLLLNLAGIEMRHDDGESLMTLIGHGLPRLRIALGARHFPERQVLFQQLHNYPVGSSKPGKERAAACKGAKYNITPVRRDVLTDIRAYVAVEADPAFASQVLKGLAGEAPRAYGLPFLGDNNFLIDRLEPVETPDEAYWYEPVDAANEPGLPDRITRLTIAIDRADMSKTVSGLFAPTAQKCQTIPERAWVTVGYAGAA